MTELLPTKASFRPGEDIAVVLDVPEGTTGSLTVLRLGDPVLRLEGVGPGAASLGALDQGTYGVEYAYDGGALRTAVEVTEDPTRRLRYGFVASYSPEKDVDATVRRARRLHLNGIQFYDWAYRHADLLGGGEEYQDALDQTISLATVRRLVQAFRAAGAASLGYAAVYGVGHDEWPQWEKLALTTPSGTVHSLGDFLNLVDPAAEPWLSHFAEELDRSTAEIGFDGFHLDQYGYPKYALTPDGRGVDLAESFVALIERIRAALPPSRLVFNNVNDFPTWATAPTSQDAVYVEVWPPHVTLESLVRVIERAKASRREQPVVLAAYQHVYAQTADPASADRAAAFTMATAFSHGATQLLAGEADRVLVDPYYVRNHPVVPETEWFLARWYDFLVEHDALLMDPEIHDVTGSYAGGYNDDVDVAYAETPVTEAPAAGAVWRRVTSTPQGLVVHLINLNGQPDTLWDAPRAVPVSPGEGTLRLRRTRAGLPRIRVADPDSQAHLTDVPYTVDGDYLLAQLPEPNIWQIVHLSED
ncbi:glycoside hydrolase family 66 protein [Sinomonas sp. P47F7]|uniref:glycoside hydrolase family 66 protein n=1 Tax=Sinomonas sp. P47F7 TaxID=3410987 RepID=UPI003BF51139